MFPQLIIACDFDGTVTRQDTLVEILDVYGSPQWRRVQDKVVSGEMSIREGLQAEMHSVHATPEELKSLLKSRVTIEPSFLPFLKMAQKQGIPLVLLTGGFDFCIETVLVNSNLPPLPYLANRLLYRPHSQMKEGQQTPETHNGSANPEGAAWGPWRVEFPYPSVNCVACGHCKGDPILNWNKQGYTTIFVGNGVTDRCAAQAAQLTFAKDELKTWCESNRVAYVPFSDFEDVQKELGSRGWL